MDERFIPLEPVYSKPRTREYVYMLVFLALFTVWLDGGNLAGQIIEERKASIQAERQRCEVYTKALTAVLNGRDIEVDGATRVSCKARHLGS